MAHRVSNHSSVSNESNESKLGSPHECQSGEVDNHEQVLRPSAEREEEEEVQEDEEQVEEDGLRGDRRSPSARAHHEQEGSMTLFT